MNVNCAPKAVILVGAKKKRVGDLKKKREGERESDILITTLPRKLSHGRREEKAPH